MMSIRHVDTARCEICPRGDNLAWRPFCRHPRVGDFGIRAATTRLIFIVSDFKWRRTMHTASDLLPGRLLRNAGAPRP